MTLLYRGFVFIVLAVLFSVSALAQQNRVIESKDFSTLFERAGVEGSVVVTEIGSNRFFTYNESQLSHPFTPASTFKIFNALVSIQTGVAADPSFALKWDGVDRRNPNWNRDQTMKEAFSFSTVWFYQELARRVGREQMHDWMLRLQYGNADTTGGEDKFWLTGGLRITPFEQVDFLSRLQRLHLVQNGMSVEAQQKVKAMMLVEETPGYKLYAKTGWGVQDETDIGWYVGFIETGGKAYAFATCIQSDDEENHGFAQARANITRQVLEALEILPKQ